MANWVRCTRAADGVSIVINLDAAASIAEAKKDGQSRGTMVAFPGGAGDSVLVKESADDILKRGGIKHA